MDFREATIQGQAPDKGLYFPGELPPPDPGWMQELADLSNDEIALRVIKPYVGDTIPPGELMRIVRETVQFAFPLVPLDDRIFSLELFHGPTLAFKDVGARFMSRCLGYFVRDSDRQVTVLVATSGDTGGAVANGFYDVDGVRVVILYPSGKVSGVQELQLTTPGHNVTALEVGGTFDDCQQMVKEAFADETLRDALFLTSANSINVARWLPQQFYYFFAWRQWPEKNRPPAISVPSGNFGNICAGLLASRTGLPVRQFIAACNANDVVTRYLQTGKYDPRKAVPTLSNAMDVGDPSNFVRILELFDRQFPSIRNILASDSFSDAETRGIISRVYTRYGYLLDPHGAVGYGALKNFLDVHPGERGLFLETAHPVKFFEAVEAITGHPVPLPAAVEQLRHRDKKQVAISADFRKLREFLLDSSRT